MQVRCPHCHHALSADQVNIQRMVALCDACDSLFEFTSPRAKAKRRKATRPPALKTLSGDPLHLAFRTNFRLDKNERFSSSAIVSGVFSLVGLMMFGLALEGELPLVLPVAFLVMASAAWYSLATIVYNRTHIRMGDDAIEIARRPLPALTQTRRVGLHGVESFFAEETAASQREGYDTPRFHVWAQAGEGSRSLVVGDLTEEYADYVASRLNRHLVPAAAESAARLADSPAEQDVPPAQDDDASQIESAR